MLDQLKSSLEKLPFAALLLVLFGYLGYDYYNFKNDPGSPLLLKQGELANVQAEVKKLEQRVREVEEFKKTLDTKRQELRTLIMELEQTKGGLGEDLDVPGFMKMVIAEAQHSGLIVTSLKPGELTPLEYVMQQTFDLSYTGVFAQSLGFLDRLEKLKRIIRVDSFSMKPKSKSDQKFVELEGSIQLKTYRYIGTKADEIGKKSDSGSGSGLSPGSGQAAPSSASQAAPETATNPAAHTGGGAQ